MLGLYVRLDELITEMDRVRYARGEHGRLAVISKATPMGDDITDELRLIDPLGEFVLDVVAMPNVHADQIGPARREHLVSASRVPSGSLTGIKAPPRC